MILDSHKNICHSPTSTPIFSTTHTLHNFLAFKNNLVFIILCWHYVACCSNLIFKKAFRPHEHSPENQLTKSHSASTSLKYQSWSLCGFDHGTLHICFCCVVWSICGTPTSGSRACLLTLMPAFRSIFLLQHCLVQPWYENICLVLL